MGRLSRRIGAVAVVAALAVAGCGAATSTGGTATATVGPSDPTSGGGVLVKPGPRPRISASGVEPGLAALVAVATKDLASRLSVAPERVGVLTAVSVTWPDSSLGCPKPGMAYAQVLTDGVFVELQVDGVTYRYHGGVATKPFLCEA
jgi:hypothetical protein